MNGETLASLHNSFTGVELACALLIRQQNRAMCSDGQQQLVGYRSRLCCSHRWAEISLAWLSISGEGVAHPQPASIKTRSLLISNRITGFPIFLSCFWTSVAQRIRKPTWLSSDHDASIEHSLRGQTEGADAEAAHIQQYSSTCQLSFSKLI